MSENEGEFKQVNKKRKTVYEELGLKPQTWIELHKKDGKIQHYRAVAHAGYSREGRPFNEYEENLYLVIEGDENDLWRLHNLLDRMIFHLPADKQQAKKLTSRNTKWFKKKFW